MDRRRSKKIGQNLSISIKTSTEFRKYYSWVKASDEIQNYCKDLGELKDRTDADSDSPIDLPIESDDAFNVNPQRDGFSADSEPSEHKPSTSVLLASSASNADAPVSIEAVTFELKANQELRFEVRADSNQQARRSAAVLVLTEGLAEVCGAELALQKPYATSSCNNTAILRYPSSFVQLRIS
jgi:hypothetical protein